MTQHVREIEAAPSAEILRALTLEFGNEVFAIEATSVREILAMVPVTEVPNSDAFVSGLINVRGRVVPLADLRVKFSMDRRPPDNDTRIVVFEITLNDETTIVGMLADRVHTVTDISLATMEAPPKVGMRWKQDYVRGIARHDGQFIILPDLGRIFGNDVCKGIPQDVEERT